MKLSLVFLFLGFGVTANAETFTPPVAMKFTVPGKMIDGEDGPECKPLRYPCPEGFILLGGATYVETGSDNCLTSVKCGEWSAIDAWHQQSHF